MATSNTAKAWADNLGNDWLERNRPDLGEHDNVSIMIENLKLKPRAILELGCSNGWRLNALHKKYGCPCLGIDPSGKAIVEAEKTRTSNLSYLMGTADKIPTPSDTFDVIILGFCMWAIDPAEWFAVAAETTRVLVDGGHLFIHDYLSPRPFKREYPYGQTKGPIYSYCMDWEKLWLAHPGYRKAAEHLITPKWEVVSVLRKDFANALPVSA